MGAPPHHWSVPQDCALFQPISGLCTCTPGYPDWSLLPDHALPTWAIRCVGAPMKWLSSHLQPIGTRQDSQPAYGRAPGVGCPGPCPGPPGFVKAIGPAARQGFTGYRTGAAAALSVRRAPVTAAPLRSPGRLRAAADLPSAAPSPGGMGGEVGSAAAVGSEGRVKSLGLVFEDERKGCYSSGETVAGHVLLEAAEPVALRALRLEAHGRATATWGPSPGAASPAAASEVEYLNVRLSLREPPAGERGPRPRGSPMGHGGSAEGLAGTGRARAGGCPPAGGGGGGIRGWGPPTWWPEPRFGGRSREGNNACAPCCKAVERSREGSTLVYLAPPGRLAWACPAPGVPGPSRTGAGMNRCHGNLWWAVRNLRPGDLGPVPSGLRDGERNQTMRFHGWCSVFYGPPLLAILEVDSRSRFKMN